MSEASNPTPGDNNPAPNHPELQGRVDPPKAEDKKQEPKSEPKKKQYIDLDGEQVDLEEIKRDRKKYKAADQRFRETAQMRKEVEEFYETLLSDPEKILSDPRIPLKKRELAEKWLLEQLEEASGKPVDPKDKELHDTKQKLKSYEEREAEEKQKAEHAEYQKVVESRREAIAQSLTKSIELSPLAQDPDTQAATIREMALYMKLCRDAKYETSPEEIAAHVESKHNKAIQALVRRLKGERLIRYLGEDIINEVRKYDLDQLKRARDVPPPQQAEDWQPRENRKREFVDPNTLRRR